MTVIRVEVVVRVRVTGSISVFVFMRVKDDLKLTPEGIREPAKSPQIWNMRSALEPGNHGFSHTKTFRKLGLRLVRIQSQVQKRVRARGGDRFGIVRSWPSGASGRHERSLASSLSRLSKLANTPSNISVTG
jgi:hypothetical protein